MHGIGILVDLVWIDRRREPDFCVFFPEFRSIRSLIVLKDQNKMDA
jgi:hypothetical protein